MAHPPFTITNRILNLVAEIQQGLGALKAGVLVRPSPKLRKESKIKTVHHSLAIEGNVLTEDQITAILEKKRVLGPKTQILEVSNALDLYEKIAGFDPRKEKDFLRAHRILMKGLVENAGRYRSKAVGMMKGGGVSRIAPPARQVPGLMGELFRFLKSDKQTHPLIKACVFHYELEFIHPFSDGNGRMGRLWQQRILMAHSPIFEFLVVESLIHRDQLKYYEALEASDLAADSAPFIEFSLGAINSELKNFQAQFRPRRLTAEERIERALEHFGERSFSRKHYQALHTGLSAASASRDLARAVSQGRLAIQGTKATAVYRARSK